MPSRRATAAEVTIVAGLIAGGCYLAGPLGIGLLGAFKLINQDNVQGTLQNLMTNVGANWLTDLGREGWQRNTERWLQEGRVNHDLQQAAGRALITALDLLERQWKKELEAQPTFRNFAAGFGSDRRQGEEIFRRLKATAERIQEGRFTLTKETVDQAVAVVSSGSRDTGISLATDLIGDTAYGAEPALLRLLREGLVPAFAFTFTEEIKHNEVVWRGYTLQSADEERQRLQQMQTDLADRLDRILQSLVEDVTARLDAQAEMGVATSRDLALTLAEVRSMRASVAQIEHHLLRDKQTYGSLPARFISLTQSWLDYVFQEEMYDLITPRPEMELEIAAFLDDASTAGFLLLGESGAGKSTLLAALTMAWQEAGELVLGYLASEFHGESDFGRRICNDLHLHPDGIEDLRGWLRQSQQRLILIFDGINGQDGADVVLQRICELCRRHHEQDAAQQFKVIVAFRSTFFEATLERLQGNGTHEKLLFPPRVFRTKLTESRGSDQSTGQATQTHRFVLEPMPRDTLEAAYERYRSYTVERNGQIVKPFCPTTIASALTPQARAVLSNPWYLRLAVEAYNGEPIPPDLRGRALFSRVCDHKLNWSHHRKEKGMPTRATLIDDLVREFRRRQVTAIRLGEARSLSRDWEQAIIDQYSPKSVFQQLCSEDILRNTNGRIDFVREQILEFLISEQIADDAGGWDALTASQLKHLASEAGEYASLAAAIDLLVLDAVLLGRDDLIAACFLTEPALPREFFTRLVSTLDRMRTDQLDRMLASLTQHAPVQAMDLLDYTRWHFVEQARPRPALACAEQVLATLEAHPDLIATERKQYAAALMSRGIARLALQQLDAALADYDAAIAIHRQLVEAEGHTELRNDLAMTLNNRGSTYDRRNQLSEALADYDAAITIRRQLVEAESHTELRNDLAMTLNNKALTLERRDPWEASLPFYSEAISLRQSIVVNGGWWALADLLNTYWNRLHTLLTYERHQAAADDIVAILVTFRACPEDDPVRLHAERWIGHTTGRLHREPQAARDAVYAELGEWAGLVRALVEQVNTVETSGS